MICDTVLFVLQEPIFCVIFGNTVYNIDKETSRVIDLSLLPHKRF